MELHNAGIEMQGRRLWFGWKSSCSLHLKWEVRIPTATSLNNFSTYCNLENPSKGKRGREWPIVKNRFPGDKSGTKLTDLDFSVGCLLGLHDRDPAAPLLPDFGRLQVPIAEAEFQEDVLEIGTLVPDNEQGFVQLRFAVVVLF